MTSGDDKPLKLRLSSERPDRAKVAMVVLLCFAEHKVNEKMNDDERNDAIQWSIDYSD